MKDSIDTIPLFPLNSILFPKGRISLQIFESRYVDMVRQCMKDQSGFGVVLIDKGSEVARPGQKLNIHRVGTFSRVVDWNQLPNGLLGITAEGEKTFQVEDTWRESNDLIKAKVVYRQEDAVGSPAVEAGEEFQEFIELLEGLSKHPAIEDLKLDIEYDNLREVAWRLSELLPIPNRDKQTLLEIIDPLVRLEQIDIFIKSLNQ